MERQGRWQRETGGVACEDSSRLTEYNANRSGLWEAGSLLAYSATLKIDLCPRPAMKAIPSKGVNDE
jgi:hypothetical protein